MKKKWVPSQLKNVEGKKEKKKKWSARDMQRKGDRKNQKTVKLEEAWQWQVINSYASRPWNTTWQKARGTLPLQPGRADSKCGLILASLSLPGRGTGLNPRPGTRCSENLVQQHRARQFCSVHGSLSELVEGDFLGWEHQLAQEEVSYLVCNSQRWGAAVHSPCSSRALYSCS